MSPKPPSDDQSGSSLRSAVCALLRSRYGNSAVREEVIVRGHKAADVVFAPNDLPGRRTNIAVECKQWSSPLSAADIRSIASEYAAARESGSIQSLYIISIKDVAATVKATIDDFHWITFMTFAQFQANIIDFSTYLDFLIDSFSKSSLDKYYVPSRVDAPSPNLLHDEIIIPWLNNRRARPLALIAGYGMGKTTYSRFLAQYLARLALEDFGARIPILLPLGAIMQQQNIRSLISYLFADQHRVPGYSYSLFEALNNNGRFVLIFDAFDEMKYAMSTNDIKHNLSEISDLITPNSKAILMGRPDPFLNDDQLAMLSGKEKIIGRLAPTNKFAAFDVKKLGYFNQRDIVSFMTRYLSVISPSWITRAGNINKSKQARLKSVQNSTYYELARRPVQAKMIAELLVTPDFKPDELGIYQLYEHFVAYVMKREIEKPARMRIDEDRRLLFLRSVAWWLWTKKEQAHFAYSELPGQIVQIVSDKRSITGESIIRELLIGSLLDRATTGLFEAKGAEYFYFAHKSYWEFLVCEYILKQDLTENDFVLISSKITPQLKSFLEGAGGAAYNNICVAMINVKSQTSIMLYEAAARSPIVHSWFEADDLALTKNQVLLMVLLARRENKLPEFRSWQEMLLDLADRRGGNFAGLMFGLAYWAATDSDARQAVLAVLCVACGRIVNRWLQKIERLGERRISYSQIDSEEESCVWVFLDSLEGADRTSVTFDLDRMLQSMVEQSLISVDERSVQLNAGSEQISAEAIDRLARFGDASNVMVAIRSGYNKIQTARVDEDDAMLDGPPG